MITGDISDTRYMTDDFFKKATGIDNKKVVYIEAANHIETYWMETRVCWARNYRSY